MTKYYPTRKEALADSKSGEIAYYDANKKQWYLEMPSDDFDMD